MNHPSVVCRLHMCIGSYLYLGIPMHRLSVLSTMHMHSGGLADTFWHSFSKFNSSHKIMLDKSAFAKFC